MNESLDSPFALAKRLGEDLNPGQQAICMRFVAGEDAKMDLVDTDEGLQALAICALWRMMSNKGSRVTVTATSRDRADYFMDYLENITVARDAEMQARTNWPRWNVMKYQDGGEIRYVSPRPAFLDEMPSDKHVQTLIVLGSGSSTTGAQPMLRGCEALMDIGRRKVVRVW